MFFVSIIENFKKTIGEFVTVLDFTNFEYFHTWSCEHANAISKKEALLSCFIILKNMYNASIQF